MSSMRRRRAPLNGLMVRVLVNAVAIYLAAHVIPRVHFEGGFLQLLVAGFLFGVLNTAIKPLLVFLSLPLIVLTLGVFYLVVNGLILLLLAGLLPSLRIEGLFAAVLASVFMGLVNIVVHGALNAWR